MIINRPPDRKETINGQPSAEPNVEDAPAPGARTDLFSKFAGLQNLCRQSEIRINDLAQRTAAGTVREPVAGMEDMLRGFGNGAQALLDTMPQGAERDTVARAARREVKALGAQAENAVVRATKLHQVGRIMRVLQGQEVRVRVSPRTLPMAREAMGELIAAATSIDASDRRLIATNASQRLARAVEGATGRTSASLGQHAQTLRSRIGSPQPDAPRRPSLTEDERAELQTAIGRLRELGAPDTVIDATLRDVSRQVQRLRGTAMDPATALALLGMLAMTGLVAASLEAQRRRARRVGSTDSSLALFDRLIGGLRSPADEGTAADQPGDGDDEDDENDEQSIVPRPDTSVAAEPPPNPEDDPLFILMTQTIAGQIVEKGLGETPAIRQEIERHARQLLPQVRDLYPGGIQKEEVQRIIVLGTEEDKKKFRPGEVVTGVLLERRLSTALERAPHIGDDWIDPRTNTTYDGVLGNMPPEHYSFKGAKAAINEHVRKATGMIVVDLHRLTEAQIAEVKELINTDLPADQVLRIEILE